ncbi:MAG: twitching motility protein PilT [Cryobacterium sp.]|nr:twitching motility protein PilT [Cryobacterium sp.]
MNVFDASALLAYLRGEEGAAEVRELLELGGACGAATRSETAQKVRASGADWDLARALLVSYDLTIEPVTAGDAEEAALTWRKGEGLSLSDLLCLALAARLGATAWTCDSQWSDVPGVKLLR